MLKNIIIIPARYQSTRFPGKPLVDIAGKSMIQRTYEQAKKTKAQKVIIATDDKRIFNHCQEFNAEVVMTSFEHQTGTDRIIEVIQKYKAKLIINIQGDEPFISPNTINRLINNMGNYPMGTIAKHNNDYNEFLDPNTIKVVTNNNNEALYFSRAPIPYPRNKNDFKEFLSHWGIYAYQYEFLTQLANWEQSYCEKLESLEQLRVLENNKKILVVTTNQKSIGIDTPKDLQKALKFLEH